MKNLKNMLVLKNLPSNLIEEAILILKPNQKVKNIEYTAKKFEKGREGNPDDYIVKEAEMLISSYLSKNDISNSKKIKQLEKKYKRLKMLSIFLGIIIISISIIKIL